MYVHHHKFMLCKRVCKNKKISIAQNLFLFRSIVGAGCGQVYHRMEEKKKHICICLPMLLAAAAGVYTEYSAIERARARTH